MLCHASQNHHPSVECILREECVLPSGYGFTCTQRCEGTGEIGTPGTRLSRVQHMWDYTRRPRAISVSVHLVEPERSIRERMSVWQQR